jgi:hypothetical protein
MNPRLLIKDGNCSSEHVFAVRHRRPFGLAHSHIAGLCGPTISDLLNDAQVFGCLFQLFSDRKLSEPRHSGYRTVNHHSTEDSVHSIALDSGLPGQAA